MRDEDRALWYRTVAVHNKVCMGNRSPSSTGFTGSKWRLIVSSDGIAHTSQVTEPFLQWHIYVHYHPSISLHS